jgi:hypothetical protein
MINASIEFNRNERQIRFFGKEGQERLGNAHVAVVGLGGLGSHVCQQLAYLGIGELTLMDADIVSTTSLNRLIGATEVDVGTLKVSIAARQISLIQPATTIHEIPHALTREYVLQDGVDLVIGCLDNDFPRLLLTDLASRMGVPYVDAATDILEVDGNMTAFGGHIQVAGVGQGCLYCRGILNQNEIRIAQMNEQERKTFAKIYGMPLSDLDKVGPSVVTLNGVVSSIATTEALMILTKIRPPKALQYYYGHMGSITTSKDHPLKACPYCREWGAISSAIN